MQNTRIVIALVLLLVIVFCAQGQVIDIQHDHYGNEYVLNENRLEKRNTDGALVGIFDLPQTAYVTSFDVSNPMRILVFSSDFNTVLFLDNYLSQITEAIQLDDFDYYNCLLACSASRGGFWIFDGSRNQIVHIDPLGSQDLKSGEIELVGKPIFLQEYERQLFLSDDSGNLLIFNGYAGFVKSLPLGFSGCPVVKNDCVYYVKEQVLFCYDLNHAESKEIMRLPVPIKRFSINDNVFVYRFDGNLKRIQMR